jgi:hypothetical protein
MAHKILNVFQYICRHFSSVSVFGEVSEDHTDLALSDEGSPPETPNPENCNCSIYRNVGIPLTHYAVIS